MFILNQISESYLFHYFFRNMTYLEAIYLFLLLCSVIINQKLISEKNNVNQCGLSYRQVIKVVTKSIQSYNQTSQQIQQIQQIDQPVQPIQQDQIQPVQLPQFGLYQKNRNYIHMIFIYRI